MAVFILEDALSVWTNLNKHLLFVWLFVSSIKMGTRCIIRLDELSSVICLERHTTENGLSRQVMRPLPVFILACSAGVFHGRALNNKFSSRI